MSGRQRGIVTLGVASGALSGAIVRGKKSITASKEMNSAKLRENTSTTYRTAPTAAETGSPRDEDGGTASGTTDMAMAE